MLDVILMLFFILVAIAVFGVLFASYVGWKQSRKDIFAGTIFLQRPLEYDEPMQMWMEWDKDPASMQGKTVLVNIKVAK